MKRHAKEYKADVNQMFVAGDSSGGHTAFFSQLMREDGNVNIYLRETADMNICERQRYNITVWCIECYA